jgi:hypothetical protein
MTETRPARDDGGHEVEREHDGDGDEDVRLRGWPISGGLTCRHRCSNDGLRKKSPARRDGDRGLVGV